MLQSIINLLFGCDHKHLTRPFTPDKGTDRGYTYVVCLDCGKNYSYDLQNMRIGKQITNKPIRSIKCVPQTEQ